MQTRSSESGIESSEGQSPEAIRKAGQVLLRFFQRLPSIGKLIRESLSLRRDPTLCCPSTDQIFYARGVSDDVRYACVRELCKEVGRRGKGLMLDENVLGALEIEDVNDVKGTMEKFSALPKTFSNLFLRGSPFPVNDDFNYKKNTALSLALVLKPNEGEKDNCEEWRDVTKQCSDIWDMIEKYEETSKGENGASERVFCVWLGYLWKRCSDGMRKYTSELRKTENYALVLDVWSTMGCLACVKCGEGGGVWDKMSKSYSERLEEQILLKKTKKNERFFEGGEDGLERLRSKRKTEMMYVNHVTLCGQLFLSVYDTEVPVYQIQRGEEDDVMIPDCNPMINEAGFVIFNIQHVPRKVMQDIVKQAGNWRYAAFGGVLWMFLKSIATIHAFTTPSTTTAGVGREERMKQERLVDDVIGYTEFQNKVYRAGVDDQPCNFMIYLQLLMEMIMKIPSNSLICDEILRIGMEKKLARYERECDEIFQLYGYQTAESLKDRMKELLLALLHLIGDVPTQCMIWKMNKYFRETLFPKMYNNPEPYLRSNICAWRDWMTVYKAGHGVGYLDDALADFKRFFKCYKQAHRIDNKMCCKESMKSSVAFMFMIPLSMVHEDSKQVAHLYLYQDKKAKLDREFVNIARLLALCCSLSTTLDEEGNPITFSDHNAKYIENWKHESTSLRISMRVHTFYRFLFAEIFEGHSSGKLVKAFFEALVEIVRGICFTGAYKSDARLDAHMDKEAQSGKYSAVLRMGYMLIPRLKKWVKDSARITKVNMEIHTEFFDELVAKLAFF